jgi:hypothetical protein
VLSAFFLHDRHDRGVRLHGIGTGADRLRSPPAGPVAQASERSLLKPHWHGDPSDKDPPTAFPHTGLAYNPSDFAHHLTRRARGMPFWWVPWVCFGWTLASRDHCPGVLLPPDMTVLRSRCSGDLAPANSSCTARTHAQLLHLACALSKASHARQG